MIVDQHELRVYSGSTELEPLETAGTLTVDRGWSPYVQGTLTVRAPAADAATAPGSTITLELTQRFGDFGLTRDLTDLYAGGTTADLTTAYAGGTTADLTALLAAGSWNSPVRAATGRTFTLLVASRTRSRDEHRLQLVSLEAAIQDWVWYEVTGVGNEGVDLSFEGDTTRAILTAIIDAHAAETSYAMPEIVMRANPAAVTPIEHTIENGSATIGYLDPFNIASRHRLYSPGDSTIVLDDVDRDPGTTFTAEVGDNLIDWEIADERYRPLMMRFQGTVEDSAARPIYSSLAFPEVNAPHEIFIDAPHIFRSPGLISGVTVPIVAYLDRRGLDESPVRLVTVSDYSAEPGASITYTLPDESPVNDSIDAITWQLGGRWEMDIWV